VISGGLGLLIYEIVKEELVNTKDAMCKKMFNMMHNNS
jgi:hypothetical protein